MTSFNVLANLKKRWAVRLRDAVKKFLQSRGFAWDSANPEYTIVIGGDGTLYYYLDELEGKVLLIGSESSYRAQLNRKNWRKGILKLLHAKYIPLPVMQIKKGNRVLTHFMNDAVFHSNNYCVARIKCLFNGNKIEFRGDGLVIATPFGSTAYSYSAGGASLSLRSKMLCITPISPCFRSASPATTKCKKIIVSASKNTCLVADGRVISRNAGGRYVIMYSRKCIKYLQR